eukprot:SAG11_NODE_11647_length_746_cov_438.646059_2_plen_73_part_00
MTLYEQIETNGDLKIKVDKIVAEIRAEKYTGDSLELEKTLDSLGGLSLQKFRCKVRISFDGDGGWDSWHSEK